MSHYEKILVEMKPSLLGFLVNRGMTYIDAQDLYQDMFIKVKITLETGITFDKDQMFRGWVVKVLRNMHIDILRKKMRSKEVEMVPISKGLNILSAKPNPDLNAEEQITHDDLISECIEAVDKLPKDQKNIIQFRIFKGMSYKDIVDKTGLGINTLLGQMRYAKSNLKRMIIKN